MNRHKGNIGTIIFQVLLIIVYIAHCSLIMFMNKCFKYRYIFHLFKHSYQYKLVHQFSIFFTNFKLFLSF